jgi:hypothetical protein
MAGRSWVSNQRGGKRYRPLRYYPVNVAGQDELFGHVADLSAEGLLLLRMEPLEVGRTWRVVVKLDEAIRGRDILELAVQSRWCKVTPNGDRYEVGMRIKAVSRQDAEAIAHLIRYESFESLSLSDD